METKLCIVYLKLFNNFVPICVLPAFKNTVFQVFLPQYNFLILKGLVFYTMSSVMTLLKNVSPSSSI